MYVRLNPLQPLRSAANTAVMMVVVGTGSIYGIENSDNWLPYLQHRVKFTFKTSIQNHSNERVDVRTALEHIENIRTVFNPAISELAFVFDVSRQAIYKWLSSDSRPEPENLARVQALSQIADSFKKAGVERAGSLLKIKIVGNQSLMDIVKFGDDWHDAVDVLITESRAMDNAYRRSGLATTKAKPTSDWQTSQSIPASREDI